MITNSGIDGYELGLITCGFCRHYDKLRDKCNLLGNRMEDDLVSDDDDAFVHVSVSPEDFCSFGEME
jgi:hypothetical protein